MSRQFKKRFNRYNRNRSLLVSQFQPETWEEAMVWEVAKEVGETDMRFLMSIKDRYGYQVIADARNEMRQAIAQKRYIRSPKRFLNHLIQERLKGGVPNG